MTPRPHAAPLALLATLALVLVTAIWGSTFVIIKDALSLIDPRDFLAIRFTLAALILLPFVLRGLRRAGKQALLAGVGIGAVYGVAQILQTVGLAHTSASASGFLTGAYVVMTPFLARAVMRSPLTKRVLTASIVALAGIGVLSLTGFAIGAGEALTLASAFVYALHIVLVAAFAESIDPLLFAVLQLIGIAAITVPAALPDGITLQHSGSVWFAILYTAVLASVVVLFLQSWAQQHLSAATAAVIMALEPLFAAGFAVALGMDALTVRLLVGGGLIMGAILLATVEAAPRAAPHSSEHESSEVHRLERAHRAGSPTS